MKKTLKKLMALMLSLVMLLGFVPNFANTVWANELEENLEFRFNMTDLIFPGKKISEVGINACNISDYFKMTFLAPFGEITNLIWSKYEGGEWKPCEADDTFDKDTNYQVTFDFNLPGYSFVKGDDTTTLGDELDLIVLQYDCIYSSAFSTNDLDSSVSGWSYASDSENIHVKFFVNHEIAFRPVHNLKYFYDADGNGFEEDEEADIYDLACEDTFLSRIGVGTTHENASPLVWKTINDDNDEDNDGTDYVTNGEARSDLKFKDGWRYVYDVCFNLGSYNADDFFILNGSVMYSEDELNEQGAPYVVNFYKIDKSIDDFDNPYIVIHFGYRFKEDPILDLNIELDDVEYGDRIFNFNVTGSDIDKVDEYEIVLRRGTYDRETYYRFPVPETYIISDNYFNEEDGKISCFASTVGLMDPDYYALDNEDYTFVIYPIVNDRRLYRNIKVIPFSVSNDNYRKFNVNFNGMTKDSTVSDWVTFTLTSTGDEAYKLNQNAFLKNIMELDELSDAFDNVETTFEDMKKVHATYVFITKDAPKEFKVSQVAGSDYKDVTLTYNKDMLIYEDQVVDTFDVMMDGLTNYFNKPQEYDLIKDYYDDFENCYNYFYDNDVCCYYVLARVTFNFDEEPAPTSTGSKSYKAKDENKTAEKISGSGKKGSKRTIVPIEGKKVASVVVKDKNGNKVDVTKNADGTYSFVQPASDVTVEVTYKNREIRLYINELNAYVDDELNKLDVTPVIRNDRTMLPIRFVAENLGAKVEWDEKNPEYVLITKGDIKIEITLGSDKAKVNGKEFTLDSVAFAENDRTYLPVRFVSEQLNAIVEWNEAKPMEVKIYER